MRNSDHGYLSSLTYYSLLWRPEILHSMVIDFIVERLLPDCLITFEESHFQVATQWLTLSQLPSSGGFNDTLPKMTQSCSSETIGD